MLDAQTQSLPSVCSLRLPLQTPVSLRDTTTQPDHLGLACAVPPPITDFSDVCQNPSHVTPLKCHHLCDSSAMECGDLYENFLNSLRNLLSSSCGRLTFSPAACGSGTRAVWQHSQTSFVSGPVSSLCVVPFCVLFPTPYLAHTLAHSKPSVQSCRIELKLKK